MDDYEEIEPTVRRSRLEVRCLFCLAASWFLATFLTVVTCFLTWIGALGIDSNKYCKYDHNKSNVACPETAYTSGSLLVIAAIAMFPAIIGLCPGGSTARTVMGLLGRMCVGERHSCVKCCRIACGCFLSIIVGSALGPLQLVSAALMTYNAYYSSGGYQVFNGVIAIIDYFASALAFVVSYSLCIAYAVQQQM